MNLFEMRGLRRVYRTRRSEVVALDDVDLDVRAGQRLGVVGESGSGKSTLVRLMAALDQPTAGTVTFDAQAVNGVPERRLGFLRSRVQMVFQDPRGSLDPRMRVRDIVAEPLVSPIVAAELGDLDRADRVRQVLAEVGLPADAGDRYPHEFSGGQRQRVAIARALAPHPDVLIADEAVSALDVSVRAHVLNLLMRLVDDLGLTLVFVSHDLGVVRHLCPEAVVLQSGRIVEAGPTQQLFAHPNHEYTARLVAAIPTFRTRA